MLALLLALSAGGAEHTGSDDGGGCAAFAGQTEPALRYHRPHVDGTQHAQATATPELFTFGTGMFALTFGAKSLALHNITSCAPGREQGFLWPAPHVEDFSLWQLNYSDCTQLTPGGFQLDALGSPAASRNHSLQQAADGRHVLTLRWQGIPTELPVVRMDVTITIVMRSGSAQAAMRGHVAVHRSAGRRACIQSMALPNFERWVCHATHASTQCSSLPDLCHVPLQAGSAVSRPRSHVHPVVLRPGW